MDFLNNSLDMGNDSKRRSSRSIKRKRFDDEIVEYTLGPPQQRSRTQSQSLSSPYSNENIPILSPSTSTAQQQLIIPHQAPEIIPVQQIQIPTPTLPTTPTIIMPNEKRRGVKKTKTNKKRVVSSTTKDLGRWKPTDDLALIIGIQQTNDIKTVHRGTKFSCKFTVHELQTRWYSLLYDEAISRIAVSAMRNLHPEIVENVQSKALYTKVEEELLGKIKSTEQPTLETFQNMLTENAASFYPGRKAKALMTHWELMKQYYLLPDQSTTTFSNYDATMSFSDCEEFMTDNVLAAESKDESLEIELALADRKNKKEIRNIENELSRWNVLVDSQTNIGFSPDFDSQTLAILRGRLVRYLMRSKEITIGRSTKDISVDVDLSLEGSAYKISRKQGTIKLRNNGDFFITNEGKRPIFVDGAPLLTGNKTKLNNNNVVEISGLRFIFLINYDLINAVRAENSKSNFPLN